MVRQFRSSVIYVRNILSFLHHFIVRFFLHYCLFTINIYKIIINYYTTRIS